MNGVEHTTAVLQIANYTCGGTTPTTELQVLNTWSLTDGPFSGTIDLNPGHIEELDINGSDAAAAHKFSGTREDDEYGTHCKGTWKTAARK